jgi:1,2-diacylglycerol 3-beta-glucosyltransferase
MAAGGSATETAPKRRRGKSALFVVGCGWAGMAPHWLDPSIRLIPSITVALLLGGYIIRTVLAAVLRSAKQPSQSPESNPSQGLEAWPSVDVVVAARDEQAVIGRLVERMSLLRYPEGLLKLWVVDDGSSDRTPEVLAELQDRFPFLRLLRRSPDAGGGKSGALNEVLQQLQARWMLVLDADADLQGDTLERLIPYAEAGRWSAVQLRKADDAVIPFGVWRVELLPGKHELLVDCITRNPSRTSRHSLVVEVEAGGRYRLVPVVGTPQEGCTTVTVE